MSEPIKFYMVTAPTDGYKFVIHSHTLNRWDILETWRAAKYDIKEIPPETTIGELIEELNG